MKVLSKLLTASQSVRAPLGGPLLLLLALPAQGAGIDSLRLDPVPIDARVECDRVFFSSSRRLPGTIFVMPRVAIGLSGDSPLFAIEPAPGGGYRLHVGVYFPRDDERVKARFNRAMSEANRCNFETVQYFLNKKKASGETPVDTIARMPLTSIEVAIPGIAKPYLIGRISQGEGEVDILSYFGASYTASFLLTEEEKDEVQARMAHAQGLEFGITFRFQARRLDGSVSAEIDWSALSASLEARAGAKLKVTAPELEAMLRTSMSKQNVKISREEGQSAAFDKIADRVVEMVLSQKDLAPAEKPTKALKEKEGDGAVRLIDLRAAIEFLHEQSTKTFFYEQVGKAESATAATSVNIKTRILDPYTREVQVVSGEADPTVPGGVKAGQSISFTPAYSYATRLEFKEKKSFLTAEQIKELDLPSKFEDLETGRMVIKNQEINGRLVGVGKWSLSAGPDALLQIYTSDRYNWERIERIPMELDEKPERVFKNGVTLEALHDLPVGLTFSALGRRMYTLEELVGDHPNWTGEFSDSGAVIIKAKRDLGLITFRETYVEGRDYEAADVITDQVVQVERGMIYTTRGQPVTLQTAHRTKVKAKTLVMYVSRPR